MRTYDAYGIPYAESQARFREALDVIRLAWTGEPFSYAGDFYKVDNATVTPRRVPAAAPADPHGRHQRRDVPDRGAPRAADLRGPARNRGRRHPGPARAVPRGVARRWTPRRAERVPPDPRLRVARRGRSLRGAAREPPVLLRPADRAGALLGRPGRRRAGRPPERPGRADGRSSRTTTCSRERWRSGRRPG